MSTLSDESYVFQSEFYTSRIKGAFEVNRDRVSVRLHGVSRCWLRCVSGVGFRGCMRCGRACAGLPGYGSRRRGGLRAWRAG
jgi:hypothetical protein